MSEKITPTNLQTNALNSINSTAESVEQEKTQKEAKYEAAKTNYNIFDDLRKKALSKFESAKRLYQKGKGISDYSKAQFELNSVLSSYTNAENNVDILRSSYQSSIFYCGKMATTAIIANHTFA